MFEPLNDLGQPDAQRRGPTTHGDGFHVSFRGGIEHERPVSDPTYRRNMVTTLVALSVALSIGCLAFGTTSVGASSVQVHVQRSSQSAATVTDEQEAVASYEALQNNLYERSVKLYEGLPSNSCDPYSCLWPFTNAMAGTEFLYGSPGASSYATDVDARLKGLLAYADLNEISPSGASQPRAFESAVAPPEGPGGNTYYDDNAWVSARSPCGLSADREPD